MRETASPDLWRGPWATMAPTPTRSHQVGVTTIRAYLRELRRRSAEVFVPLARFRISRCRPTRNRRSIPKTV
jgi:hypothetical protein